MGRNKGSKNKTAGRSPKSAQRKGKATPPAQPLPSSKNALDFLYEQMVMKGGLAGIERKLHGAIFNAFQIVENDLTRLDEIEKKWPKEETAA